MPWCLPALSARLFFLPGLALLLCRVKPGSGPASWSGASPVTGMMALWWHCGGIVGALWDSSCLTLVIPARKSMGCFGAWATTICLVNEPPKFNGIYQTCSYQTRTVNDIWTQASICFVHGDTGTCKVWNTARRQRPPRKENPQLKLKIFWNYSPNPVCLGTWLGKITFFKSDPIYAESADCWSLCHISIHPLTFCSCSPWCIAPALISRKLNFSLLLHYQNNSLINGCLFSLGKIGQN